jgi:hypothetical protein
MLQSRRVRAGLRRRVDWGQHYPGKSLQAELPVWPIGGRVSVAEWAAMGSSSDISIPTTTVTTNGPSGNPLNSREFGKRARQDSNLRPLAPEATTAEAKEAGITGQHRDFGLQRSSGYGAIRHDPAGFGHQKAAGAQWTPALASAGAQRSGAPADRD